MGFYSARALGSNITPAQLYQWNPILGQNGQDSDREFQADTYYCIGAPTAAIPTTTSSAPSAPSPTQTGIVSNCNNYAEAVSDDTWLQFRVGQSDHYRRNSTPGTCILGADGSQCSTEFQAKLLLLHLCELMMTF